MAHYLIAQVKFTNDSWIPDYAAHVHDIVHSHGGKYLTRSGNITTLEGAQTAPDFVAIVEFPTSEALQGFGSDPDYPPYAQARKAGSDSHFIAVDTSDVAGTVPYLLGTD